MNFRYCLPRVRGKGSGLGNELITWSRAFLMGQVLGVPTLAPAFGRNLREYWRHFGTPRYDWVLQRALCATLPVVEFREKDYLDFGGGDVMQSFRAFAEAKQLFNRNHCLITTEGMWGGYYHIQAARDFINAKLHSSRFAAQNLIKLQQRLAPNKITIGMHVRLGDFAQAKAPSDYQGKFNIALPLSWYINIGKNVQQRYGENVQFLIASDGSAEQLKPLTDNLNCILTNDIEHSDCSDILALAKVDLLVCSISSFSAISAFLSDAPYLWFEPQLQVHNQEFYSIWGHEPNQQRANSPTNAAIKSWQNNMSQTPKGWPIDKDGEIPNILFERIENRNKVNILENYNADLLMYGIVKVNRL
jgi:hypothetical protein